MTLASRPSPMVVSSVKTRDRSAARGNNSYGRNQLSFEQPAIN